MRIALLAAATASLLGCAADSNPTPAPAETAATAPAAVSPAPSTATVEKPADDPRALRDPFATIAPPPPATPPNEPTRKSRRFGVSELKLVGIVAAADGARAMLVDPRGKGWIVTRGDLIGRPEMVRAETTYYVSWRVDRVRAGDVVLVRDDRMHPNATPETRVLALRSEPRSTLTDDDEVL